MDFSDTNSDLGKWIAAILFVPSPPRHGCREKSALKPPVIFTGPWLEKTGDIRENGSGGNDRFRDR